ncbi:hypothetical protein GX408_09165 [bacterium]|nr:hypothetical protein [bacterium]
MDNAIDKIWFCDSLAGYALSYKTILKTHDGGNSWHIQTETKNGLLQDLQFYNSKIGYVCGYGGTIYRTDDGGENWLRCGKGITENLEDIDFIDENTGWAVGYYGTILHTKDSGEIWEKQQLPEECESVFFRAVDFLDDKTGWAAGGAYILSTENGGITWQIQLKTEMDDAGGRFRDIKLLNKNLGFAVGQKGFSGPGILYKTSDGGNSWLRVDEGNLPNLDKVFFIDDDYGWICGWGILLSTNDGGSYWQADYFLEFLRYMQFTDREHGWISALDEGSFYRTTDAGKTWKDIPFENRFNKFFNSFFFFNNKQGVAATFLFCDIFSSNDGGLHWLHEERLPPA